MNQQGPNPSARRFGRGAFGIGDGIAEDAEDGTRPKRASR